MSERPSGFAAGRPEGRTVGAALGVLSSLASSASAGNEDELFVGNEAAPSGSAVTATVRDTVCGVGV